MGEIEAVKAVSEAVTSAGLAVTALAALWMMYRYERVRVTELEEKRIEDHKAWITTLAQILMQQGRPATITNLGGD